MNALSLQDSGLGSKAEWLVADAAPPTPTVPREAMQSRDGFQDAIAPLLPRLYRFALALSHDTTEAEDLLEEGLIKAYLHRADFAGRGSFAGWLFQILRHEHEDRMRTARRRRSLLQHAREHFGAVLEDLMAVPAPDPETWICAEQESSVLLECLRALPEPGRTVVLLCDIEELSYDEVAQQLGLPIGTVKSRHARGRARLRKALEQRKGDGR